jgi:hypothetical protein
MAILRSLDGKFYEIPDEVVSRYLIPEDKVREKVRAGGGNPDSLGDDALRSMQGGNAPASAWHNAWHNLHQG